jgi:hypothetical protein
VRSFGFFASPSDHRQVKINLVRQKDSRDCRGLRVQAAWIYFYLYSD